MKRIITAILATVLLSGALVALSSPARAALPPVPGCQYRTTTSSSPTPWRFIMSEHWWRMGSYRISAGCNQMVVVDSNGWRFDGTQCGQMWIRRERPDGSTYILDGSVKYICGGQEIVLWSRAPVNARFWIEGWPFPSSDRHSGIWPLDTARF